MSEKVDVTDKIPDKDFYDKTIVETADAMINIFRTCTRPLVRSLDDNEYQGAIISNVIINIFGNAIAAIFHNCFDMNNEHIKEILSALVTHINLAIQHIRDCESGNKCQHHAVKH